MRPAGVRVINVFPGPIDDEWNQMVPPPKLSPAALAAAVVRGAQGRSRTSIRATSRRTGSRGCRDNPKALERELGEAAMKATRKVTQNGVKQAWSEEKRDGAAA